MASCLLQCHLKCQKVFLKGILNFLKISKKIIHLLRGTITMLIF